VDRKNDERRTAPPTSTTVKKGRARSGALTGDAYDPSNFEVLMEQHIRLTVAAAESVKVNGSRSRVTTIAIQTLLLQLDDWETLINEVTGDDNLGKALKSGLNEHSVAARDLIVGHIGGDTEAVTRAIAKLQENGNNIIKPFVANLFKDSGVPAELVSRIASLWDTHLICTNNYVRLLAEAESPDTSSKYAEATESCMDAGIQFGQTFDEATEQLLEQEEEEEEEIEEVSDQLDLVYIEGCACGKHKRRRRRHYK